MGNQFEQYMTTVFRNGKCFRDVYSERDEEIARHAWEWARKAMAEQTEQAEQASMTADLKTK